MNNTPRLSNQGDLWFFRLSSLLHTYVPFSGSFGSPLWFIRANFPGSFDSPLCFIRMCPSLVLSALLSGSYVCVLLSAFLSGSYVCALLWFFRLCSLVNTRALLWFFWLSSLIHMYAPFFVSFGSPPSLWLFYRPTY
jgi:hypothetical protein